MGIGLSLNQMASAVRATGRPEQRQFRTFDPSVGTYASIPAWTPTGDFEIEVEFTDSASIDNACVVSLKNTATGEFLEMQVDIPASTSLIKIGSNGRTPGSGSAIVEGLNTWRVVWAGGVLKAYLNGMLDYSVTPTATAWLNEGFDQVRVGRNHDATRHWDGIISRVKLTDHAGGDNRLYTDFARSDFVVPDSYSAANNGTLYNAAAGSVELFTLNTATDPDQWENGDKTRIIPIAGA